MMTSDNGRQPTSADTDSDTAEGVVDRPRRRWVRSGGIALTATAAIAAVAAAAVFGVKYHDTSTRNAAREAARRAVCDFGPLLATYDSKTIGTYFAAVLDHATGQWKKEFDSTSRDLRDVLTQGQVVAKAGRVRCAVETNTDTTADAILVIDQTISSVGTQGQPRQGQLAITLSLRKNGNRWLVDKVDSPTRQP